MVAIGNGANIGGGTEVTPHADPESGSVDVMVSRAVSPLAKLSYTMKMAREGSHLEHPDVDYHPDADQHPAEHTAIDDHPDVDDHLVRPAVRKGPAGCLI